ncbi:MAG: YqgE/AlgH family protein [Muribaculaceae bacterium]|nr:YqgE/AlgH family protein [Muribaculaceae bacterium]
MLDLKDLIFSGPPTATPHMGSLLLSEPLLEDNYFSRSAILVLDEPEGGGHFGLILNKPTDVTLRNLMPDWEEGERVPIYCGGPVDLQRMFLLHTLGERLGSTTEVLPGIYVGADLDKTIEYIEEGGEIDGKLRFFLGYCGWSPGQLAGEINRKSWAVNALPQCPNLLRGEGVDYWQREVKDLGEDYRGWLVVPTDPSLN